MSLFNTVNMTRRRYGAPTRTKGRTTTGAPTTKGFTGTFQATQGDSTQIEPEHEHRVSRADVYTSLDLRAVDERNNLPADEVVVGSAVYKVVTVSPWQNGLINHYKATVELVGTV